MAHLFSAARLRRSACFCRLTGVSLAVFDDMLAQLSGPSRRSASVDQNFRNRSNIYQLLRQMPHNLDTVLLLTL